MDGTSGQEDLLAEFLLIESCLQNNEDGMAAVSTDRNKSTGGPIDILDTKGQWVGSFNNVIDCGNAMNISVEMIEACARLHEQGILFSYARDEGMDENTNNLMKKAPKKSSTKINKTDKRNDTTTSSSSSYHYTKYIWEKGASSSSSSSSAAVAAPAENGEDEEEEADVRKDSRGTPNPVEQFDSATNKTLETFTSLSKAREKTGVMYKSIRSAMDSKPEGRIIQGRAFGFRHPSNTTDEAEETEEEEETSETGFVLNVTSATPATTTTENHDDNTEQRNTSRKRKLPISVPSNMNVSNTLDPETLRKMQEESILATPRDMKTIHQARKQPININSSGKQ